MIPLAKLVRNLGRDERGSILLESAILIPALAMLSVGTYQVSAMVARQNELQSAVAEAAQIALVSKPDQSSERVAIQGVIMASTGLGASNVVITNKFRCAAATALVDASTSCTSGQTVTTYLLIAVTDTFTPSWTEFGVGSALQFRVRRMVIVA